MKLGRYELLSEIGRGGMGVVHRALSDDGRDVAIKTLLETDPDAIAGFERERRLLLRFSEADGFVPILDHGQEGARRYLVMPFLPGGTLRARLESGPLPPGEAVALVRELGRALGKAHERGIVHRDLKPENVLFTAGGKPLVTDLGLAKHFRRDVLWASQSRSLSATGTIVGTPGYMAPEQIDDARKAGPAADVFALGAILHECLAGERPFPGKGMLEYVHALRAAPRPLPKSAPAWLGPIVERALAIDSRLRFADGGALARALDRPSPRRGKRPILFAGAVVTIACVGGLAAARRTKPEPIVTPRPEPIVTPRPEPIVTPRPEPPAGTVANPALGLVEEGWGMLGRGDIDGAIARATRAIELQPALAGAWGLRGEARSYKNELGDAIADETRALELEPGLAWVLVDRSVARRSSGDVAGAIRDASRAIELEPRNAMAWHARGKARAREGDLEDSLADEKRAVELQPSLAVAWETCAHVLFQQRDNRGAIEAATRAVELDARLYLSWCFRGEARLQLGDLDGAVEDATRAIELKPEFPTPWFTRAVALREKGAVAEAASDFRRYLQLDPSCPAAPALRAWLSEKGR